MEVDLKLGRLLSKDKSGNELEERLSISCRQFFTQKVQFHAAKGPDSHLEHLKARYTPLNRVRSSSSAMDSNAQVHQNNRENESAKKSSVSRSDGIPEPKMVLYNDSHLVMGWKESRPVGSGLCNLGNTCFLNSVLQCLTYTPPLFNYITSGHHNKSCNTQAFCAMCEFHRHCTRVFNSSNGQVKPIPIVKNLRAIARHFHQGRQEDAHEFLRYFIDSLQKCCLQTIQQKLDVHTKATTLVHQIFGGYHRSQVKCLDCSKMSNTFDPLLDISVDIKNSNTLLKALHHYIKPDLLEGENSYACPYCKKMTRAQKRLTVHRLPNVLTFQLKRFDYNSMFGGKVNKQVAFPEHINMRSFMSDKEGPSEWYRLYGVLVHFGYSCHSGHYYCYIRNSNNIWFCMNDSQVTQVSLSTVLQQEAYLLFYIRDSDYKPRNISFSPGSPTLNVSSSSSHFKVDHNFLGTSVKRVAPLATTGLDKTGTPLVKLPKSKPTGVVQPSPQKDAPKQLGAKGHSLSPPATTSAAVSPPKSKGSSPNTSGSGGSGNGGGSSPMMREFSIPLRKISSTTPSRSHAEKMNVSRQTISQPQQQATPTTSSATASLRFTPRQISAPSKTKKLQRTSVAPSVPVSLEEEEKPSGDGKMATASSASQQPLIKAATSIASQPASEKTKESEDTSTTKLEETKVAPAFKAIQSKDSYDQKFIGPMLSATTSSSPSLSHSPLRVTPFSLKTTSSVPPKVALVSPQPQARGKPVARVRPNPHLQEGKGQDETTPRTVSSKEGHSAATPTPHMNAMTPWKVREATSDEAFGPTLPEGREYNSSAHGWNVSSLSGGEDGHQQSKSKKHKKKKKHRKREDSSGNESEGERGGGKKEKTKNYSKKTRSRDLSRSPERGHRHHSSSLERGHYHHDVHHTPDRASHYDKYHRHKRHGHRERDRERRKYSKSGRHSHHNNQSRTSSRSRSRSPLHGDSEDRYYRRERHRVSPHRHAHHHAPLDAEEERYRKMKNTHSHQQSEYHHHRVRHSSDSGDKRVNISKSDDVRRRERKRSHHHEHGGGAGESEEEREYKKHKKSTAVVPVVEWDATTKVCSKWDGAHHNSTVEQLTALTRRSLGENVKSWDGGDNIIDSSKMEGEAQRRERDAWDAELDKGKVKKVKKSHHGNQFGSARNAFQDYQNKRNISQVKSD